MAEKLSELKDGDTFKFISGQEALYIICHNSWQKHETEGDTEYIVLKKNPKSVKCKPLEGFVEYTFKFSGVFNDYKKAVDCLICKT